MAGITKNNIASQLTISSDNQIIGSQNITEEILNGKFCFSTNYSKEEVEDLVIILNSGSTYIGCKITEQFTKE